jgi:hypothetical protein
LSCAERLVKQIRDAEQEAEREGQTAQAYFRIPTIYTSIIYIVLKGPGAIFLGTYNGRVFCPFSVLFLFYPFLYIFLMRKVN